MSDTSPTGESFSISDRASSSARLERAYRRLVACYRSVVPCLRLARLEQWLQPRPNSGERPTDLHREQAVEFAVVLKLVGEVEHRPFAECTQLTVEAVHETGVAAPEPGDQQAENPEFVTTGPDPRYRPAPARLPLGELAEFVIAVPVRVVPGVPHGPDPRESYGSRALQARLKGRREDQVPVPAELKPRQHVDLRVGHRRAEDFPL